jgi:site-specific recombinase XerD
VKAPRERTARAERVKFLPLDGLKRLWAAPTGDGAQPRRDLAILALMGIHGLRVAEVASLRVGDVDLSRQAVTVTGKGDKTRMIYLTPATAAGLASWLEIRAAVALDAALFVALGNHERGGGMSDRAIRLIVDGYLGRLGLERAGVSCHSLRHSVATWARAGGAQLDALAGMLGHAFVTTTQVYAKVVDRMAENPARYLEAVLGGATSA